MKKSDLKKVIKPLVKECIHEVLLEEGLLSNVVAEVASGLQGSVIVETRQQPVTSSPVVQEVRNNDKARQLKEQKRKMLEAIGKDAYNGVDLFENTTPMSSHEAAAPKAGSVDLGNPGDSGVDISALMGGASKIWQAMK